MPPRGFSLPSRGDEIAQPQRQRALIDVTVDRVGAALAARRRHHDVAALALDLDAFGQSAGTAAGGPVEIEDQVRAVGRAAVLAGDDRLVLGDELVPLGDAVGMILRRVDVDAAHAGRKARRQPDQVLVPVPPRADLDRIGGRLLEASGAGDRLAVGILVARRYWFLVDIHRKYRKAVRRPGQRGVEHPARRLIGRDRGRGRRPQLP